jgi:serine/threonine protein kinase/Tol biopolymer transport system component
LERGVEKVSLAQGTNLGPYEILAPIGAGGMGEVYRALDTKLKREVAVKVLPDSFARDPERMLRFQREAEVLASLNHPNIAHIYGVEQSALVMELVNGQTLPSGLPLDTALNYAKQIAEALEYAHERGVIHRDLKPANVKVTPEGVVKLLDFGLAKAIEDPASAGEDPGKSPTLTLGATRLGVILGTAAYMSPEQASGKTADRRADIWSFGVVLFEMLSGKRAFEGESVSDTLATVLKLDPDWSVLPTDTPQAIRKLIQRCLKKDRKQRLQAIGEARIAIEETLNGTSQESEAVPTVAPRKRSLVPWAIAGLLFAGLSALAFVHFRDTRVPQPLVRLDVDLGPGVRLGQVGADVILSPDASRLVYVSQNRLFTRRLDQPQATALAGTEGSALPFFSPDGQWIAFFTLGKLKKIPVEGGAVIALCDSNAGRGGSWADDGYIIAALNNSGGLSRIPSAGGTPAPVTELAPGETTHRWPQILPGGKAVLFTAHNGENTNNFNTIEVMSLGDHHVKTLQRGGSFARYLPTSKGAGYIVYTNGGRLFAIPFDLHTLAVRGTPVPVLEDVASSAANGSAQFDFSNGTSAPATLVYRNGTRAASLFTVQWLDSQGKTQPLLATPGDYRRPRLSPDGQRLALTVTKDGADDVWVYDLHRSVMTRLTFGGIENPDVVWTPDGRFIMFAADGGIAWTRSDGGSKSHFLTQSKAIQRPWSISPDGRRLAIMQQRDLWTMPVESDGDGLRGGKPEIFLHTEFEERHDFFSADGRWMAYSSNESGTFQVYVRAFPDKGGKWQISNDGGLYPVFSRNGHDLFYRTEDNQIMVASYTVMGDSFVADKPRVWSDKRIANVGNGGTYDVAPDGKRIAALMPVDGPEDLQTQNHVIFLQNFSDEVRRRTAVAGR